jgi:hypothetical protein
MALKSNGQNMQIRVLTGFWSTYSQNEVRLLPVLLFAEPMNFWIYWPNFQKLDRLKILKSKFGDLF